MSEVTVQQTTTQAPLTPERLMSFGFAYAPPLILEAAIQHRLFDTLEGGPLTAEELAAKAGTDARATRIIGNALVGLNFLAKDDDGRYRLTPESEAFLITTKPSFMGGIFRHGSRHLIRQWLELSRILGDGEPAQTVNHEDGGAQFFQEFVADIYPMSAPAAANLGRHLKLAEATEPLSVLDLAAGSGVWGIELAKQSPQVRVRAVDWEGVLPVTRQMTAKHGVADQFGFVAGDLHDAEFGTGHQLATLGHILHSEGEAWARKLLAKTAEALASGGTIAIAEFLVNADRRGPMNGLIFAVNMLVNSAHGDTFSFEEISGWLEEAGFVDARLLPSPGPSPLVLATKA